MIFLLNVADAEKERENQNVLKEGMALQPQARFYIHPLFWVADCVPGLS